MTQDVRIVTQRPARVSDADFSVAAASGQFDITDDSTTALTIAIQMTALTGGTTPAVTFSLVGVDEFNNEYALQTGTAISTGTGQQMFHQGPGMGTGNNAAIFIKYRVKWATTGGPATATCRFCAYGIAGV